MRKLLLFFFLFPFLSNAGIKPERYPKVRDVVMTFFEKYSRSQYGSNVYVKFEKSPKGYWVVEETFEDEVVNRELMWSYKKGKYLKLNYPVNAHGLDRKAFQEVMARVNEYNFKNNFFYGYVGWQQDVIEHFENKGELSDDVIYALARAYSYMASGLLHNNSGFSDPKEGFNPKLMANSLSPSELAKYRETRHTALKYFKRLQEQNPNFRTLVGSIGVKTAHEHLTAFLDLLMFQNETEALKELKPNIYTQFQINQAKNHLQSCDQNAILFVNSDGDTCPLHYVQAMEGYRTDVTLVNLSLLNSHRYIYWLRNPGVKNMSGLQFTLQDEHLIDEQRRSFTFEKSVDTIPLGDLVKEAIDPKNVNEYNGFTSYTLPKGHLQFGRGATFSPTGGYTFLASVMVYDIISHYFEKRPIYFASTVGTNACAGLQNFLQLEGFAMQLKDSEKIDAEAIGYIGNPKLLYEKLMHQLDWSGIETMEIHNERQAQNNRQFFVRLAQHYMLENKLDSARKVMGKCMEVMPVSKVPCGPWARAMLPILYQFDMDSTAREVAISAVNGYLKSIELYKEEEGVDYTLYFQQQANTIIELVEGRGQAELAEELKRIVKQ